MTAKKRDVKNAGTGERLATVKRVEP